MGLVETNGLPEEDNAAFLENMQVNNAAPAEAALTEACVECLTDSVLAMLSSFKSFR